MDKAFRATGAAAYAGIVAYWRWSIGFLTYSWLLDDTTWYCRRSFRCSPSQSGFDETSAMAEVTISQDMARYWFGVLLDAGKLRSVWDV